MHTYYHLTDTTWASTKDLKERGIKEYQILRKVDIPSSLYKHIYQLAYSDGWCDREIEQIHKDCEE